MEESTSKYENSSPCEGSAELNGEDANYRAAGMVSAPRTVMKRRIRGALVPMGKLL